MSKQVKNAGFFYVIWLLVTIAFLVLFGSGIRARRLQAASVDWQPTNGVISKDIRYTYTVDGVDYSGARLRYAAMRFGNQLEDAPKVNRPGTRVTVYYDPDHPSRSVLQRGRTTTTDDDVSFIVVSVIGWLMVVLIIIVPGINLVAMGRCGRALRKIGFRLSPRAEFGEAWDQRTDDDPGFALFDFGWTAVAERRSRLIEMRLDEFSTGGASRKAIRIELETAWTRWEEARHDHVHGIDETRLSSVSERIHAYGMGEIYLRMLDNEATREAASEAQSDSPDYWPLLPQTYQIQPFDTGDEVFDGCFPIRMAAWRIREALTDARASRTVEPLARRRRLLIDLCVRRTIVAHVDIRRLAGWPVFHMWRFASLVEPLTEDLLSFARRLEAAIVDHRVRDDRYETRRRYVEITLVGSCTKCGGDVPIGGPVRKVTCPKCGHSDDVAEERWWWHTLLHPYRYQEWGDEDPVTYEDDNIGVKRLEWRPGLPRCAHCDAELPESLLSLHAGGRETRFECSSCGGENIAFPPPQWAQKFSPYLTLVYNGERDGGRHKRSSAAPTEPVNNRCASCGTTFEVTGQSDRLVVCPSCGARSYLPDAVWSEFHPTAGGSSWFVRYDYIAPRGGEGEA